MIEKREGRQQQFVQRALTFTARSDICFSTRVTAEAAAHWLLLLGRSKQLSALTEYKLLHTVCM